MMGNEAKVREGKEKKTGEKSASTQAAIDDVEDREEHPGISYTKSGAMRQKCLIRPPPSDPSDEVEPNTNTDTIPDDTASIHQHSDYAGPNLTAPPPLHYSPVSPNSPSALVSDEGGQGLRLDSPGRLGVYDLHGGFPTGAPSPSLGARGAEVVDPFERMAGSKSDQGGMSEGQNR
jgi:hypothetical protein